MRRNLFYYCHCTRSLWT